MSVQDILDQKQEEIDLIYKVITHPAAFIIDLFGGLLSIRSHSDGYEVAWKEYIDDMECEFHRDFRHDETMDAVIFFVEKRFDHQCGIDFECELMKEKHE